MGVRSTWPAMVARAFLTSSAEMLVTMPVPLACRRSIVHCPRTRRTARICFMTDTEPRKIGVSFEVKPHAYDPVINPELFEGVLARRCIAFVVDLVIIAVPVFLAGIFIFIFPLVTFRLCF